MLWQARSNPEPTPPLPPSVAGLLPPARAVVFRALAEGIRPPPRMTVREWADARRFLDSESSPFPGPWSTALVPYMAEIMDCLSPTHPAREVTLKKSAQVAGTEAGINFFGFVADQEPGPMMVVLPTFDEAKKYNRVKLGPAIAATPALRAKIREQKSRDARGSTILFKKFPGGWCVITGANSSAGLQMMSVRFLIKEEISEWPDDVDGRGDPDELASKRQTAFSDTKKTFNVSTPGIKGACRISAKYEVSDQRRYYVPCPGCGVYQALDVNQLQWRQEEPPFGAHFVCKAHGCVIEHRSKRAMVAAGRWLKGYPGEDAPSPAIEPGEIERHSARPSRGREPGFHVWQAYSPFVPWDDTVAEMLKARDRPHLQKVVDQQTLGLEHEEKGEAPDAKRLFERRERYPRRRLVPGVLFTTGATDVQGDRLEWAVYGWDRKLSAWIVDVGIIEGDPDHDDVWRRHDEVMAARFADAWGRPWGVDAWGIDAGYKSSRVYRYARSHAHTGRVFALDGRDGWKLAPIGTPKAMDVDYLGRKIGAVRLWPVGTWDLKSDTYAALRLTLEGPDQDGRWRSGAMHFSEACSQEFFEQLTAEYLADREKRAGYSVKEWRKTGRNEQLDLAVYARALARHLSDNMGTEEWARLEATRLGRPEDAQLDFAGFWSSSRSAEEPVAEPAGPASPAPSVVLRGGGSAIVRGSGIIPRH